MNSWWVRLYTIPGIKKIALKFIIPLAIVSLGHLLIPGSALLAILHLSFLYPLITFGDLRVEGLAWNLEFHKMSVPLRELRKIFFLDILIQTTAFIACAFLSCFTLYCLFPGYESGLGWSFLLTWGTPSCLLLSVACVAAFFISSRVGEPSKFESGKKKYTFKDLVMMISFMLPAFLYAFYDKKGSSLFEFNSIFCTACFSLSIFVTKIVHFYYFKFHEKRFNNNLSGHLATIGSCITFCFIFCFMCGFLSRVELNSSHFANDTKNRALMIFDDFAPALDPETVQGLLSDKMANTNVIFKHAAPEVFQMRLSQLISEPSLNAYAHYLQYGNPSQENLVYLMRELEKRPKADDWKQGPEKYNEVRFLLVKHLPNANLLPMDLIKTRIEMKKIREIASEKKDDQK